MTDELQHQLAELLKALLAAAKDASAWAEGQIPPLVEEKIRFGRVWHSVIVILCMLAVWRLWVIARWCMREMDGDLEWIFGILGAIGGCVALTIIAGFNFHDALLAWLAPRLYIIEWLVSLTHSN